MAGFTTALPTSLKAELPQAAHCFAATQTPTGTSTNASPTVTAMSSVAGLVVGMGVSGTNIAAGSVIASIDSTTQITLSKNATGANGGLTCTGDAFKIALGIASPAGTYGAATTNYSNLTGNSDEVSCTGYTAGRQALSANISPNTSGTQAFWQWSANPSWTSATFSTSGCLIYNTAARLAGTTGRAVYVGSFGGTQTVTAGTFTVLQPTNGAGTSLLQLN